jgi:hypothetical protein
VQLKKRTSGCSCPVTAVDMTKSSGKTEDRQIWGRGVSPAREKPQKIIVEGQTPGVGGTPTPTPKIDNAGGNAVHSATTNENE